MKPFFSIITRTMLTRAELFARCKRSVDEQTFQDFEHLVLLDREGVGVAKAQEFMWQASPRGEYVFVLDDDDYLSAPDVLEKLQAALATSRPCFAVVRVIHGQLGMMPMMWGQEPQEGMITVSNVVVENVQWYAHRKRFEPIYAGDYSFVKSLFEAHAPQWIDLALVTVEYRRLGEAEPVPA